MTICAVLVWLACGGSLARAQTLYFRNNLTTDIVIELKAAQRNVPTTLMVAQGGTAAFDLVSAGPFDVIVTPFGAANQGQPVANDVVFFKRAVDLKAIATQMNGNIVEVRGIFDFMSARSNGGLLVDEDRVAVTVEFPIANETRPLMGVLRKLCTRGQWEAYWQGNFSLPAYQPPAAAPAPPPTDADN
jgi:hypothetical protein